MGFSISTTEILMVMNPTEETDGSTDSISTSEILMVMNRMY